MMQSMIQHFLEGRNVSVVTLYKRQFTLLMNTGEEHGLTRAKCKGERSDIFKQPGFRIITVDAAQDSEADVVISSCVRCNPQLHS